MISIPEVILIQDILIELYRETRGIHDRGLFESCHKLSSQIQVTENL